MPRARSLSAQRAISVSHTSHRSLQDVARWYGHAATHVLLVNAMPEGRHAQLRPFDERGWCFFEEAAASLLKTDECLWELDRFTGGETYSEIYKQLGRPRKPPMSPERFAHVLSDGIRRGRLALSVGSDLSLLCTLYESFFTEAYESFLTTYPGRTIIFYTDKGWGDADAPTLAEAIRYAARQCSFTSDKLILHTTAGNAFGEDALDLLWESAAGSRLKIK